LSGVGVLTASAVAATVVDPQQFRCGRQSPPGSGSPRASTPPAANRAWAGSPGAAIPICADCSCKERAPPYRPPCASPLHGEPTSPPGSPPPRPASAITRPWWRSPTSTRGCSGCCSPVTNRCTRTPLHTDSVVTLPPTARRFRYDDGQTHAACTWLTWRPHHEADERMRAQRAVSSMARARIDPPIRPDTELQADPSSMR
jgi:hypothetical protein